MAKEFIIERIRQLSQEDGMTDQEIGELLGYARGSIQRIRDEENIPRSNIHKRKDKPCKCVECNQMFMIRRCESVKVVCEACEQRINELQSKEETR